MANILFEERGFSLAACEEEGWKLCRKQTVQTRAYPLGRINGRAQCPHLMLYSYSHHHYNGSNDQN